MSDFNDLKCKFTDKLYYEAFIAHDGFVYEKEYIETLFENKETIISPTTGQEMKVGGIIYTKLNKYLEEFFIKHSELSVFRYVNVNVNVNKNMIIKIFNAMMSEKQCNIEDLMLYIEKHKECKFTILDCYCEQCEQRDNHKFCDKNYFNKMINTEKGLFLYLSDNISLPDQSINKIEYIIAMSDIYMII